MPVWGKEALKALQAHSFCSSGSPVAGFHHDLWAVGFQASSEAGDEEMGIGQVNIPHSLFLMTFNCFS